MNKKSQIFTVLAIVMIILTFVSFEIYSSFRERQAIKTRVSSMENFLDSIEENLERQLYISGFRIIFLAESEITKGSYVDVEDFFNEAFFNGTVNGVPNQTFLEGATYPDLFNSINDKAEKISVDVLLENSSISITQEDPWNVKFTLSSDFAMNDKRGLAKWEKKQVISSFIPIEGFEDPIFTINSIGHISRRINRTIYEGNYANGADISNFSDHVDKGYYANNTDAPSFLMRLEGNLSSDINGIESFVDIPDFILNVPDFEQQEKSVVDHIYFSGSFPESKPVSGMPAWFLIDSNHKQRYGLP